MLRNALRRVAIPAALLLFLSATQARAQFYPNDPCGCSVPMARTTSLQPVYQSCYQTIPVTTYQPVKQTVKRPVYKTEFIEEPVTVFRPVTETRMQEVPTVSYQNVTEYRTVHRDMGRWVTTYHPNQQVSPCQYDGRPGVIGWFNRTSYSLRSAFRPRYTRSRRYCPQVVAQSIPVTRRVAVHGTRQVAQNITRMVATKTTQRRPVQRISYVEQEVTVMRPQTTYRTVPMGTSVAYAPAVIGNSAVAWGDTIDSSSTRSALTPEPDDRFSRSATDADDAGTDFRRPRTTLRETETGAAGSGTKPFTRRSRSFDESRTDTPTRRSSATNPGDPAFNPNPGYDESAEEPFFDVNPSGSPSASLERPSQYVRTAMRSSQDENAERWRGRRDVVRLSRAPASESVESKPSGTQKLTVASR